jgi:hypothetical protein
VASERGKFLFFFQPLFNSFPPPFEAGCKGKALFSTQASGAENLFSGTLPGRRERPDNAAAREVPALVNFFCKAAALAEPGARLAIGSAKVAGFSQKASAAQEKFMLTQNSGMTYS